MANVEESKRDFRWETEMNLVEKGEREAVACTSYREERASAMYNNKSSSNNKWEHQQQLAHRES